MSINFSRIFKVLIGSALIGITLTSSHTAGNTVGIYSLVAIPFVLAGLFDWRPLEGIFNKFYQRLMPLSTMEPGANLKAEG